MRDLSSAMARQSYSWELCAWGVGTSLVGAGLIVLYVIANRHWRLRGAQAHWQGGWLLGAPGMTAMFTGWGLLCLSGPRLPWVPPRIAGLALLCLAGWVYWLSARRVGRWRRPSSYSPTLRTEGIYRRLRHPQALALCLAAPAFGLVTGSLPFLATFPFWVAFWTGYTYLEERCELVPVFGETYLEYRSRTPRLLPRCSLDRAATVIGPSAS